MGSVYITGKDVELLTGYHANSAIKHRRAILDSLGKTEKSAKLTIWDWCKYHQCDPDAFYNVLMRKRSGEFKAA